MLIFSLFCFFLVVRMGMMSSKFYILERKLEVLKHILYECVCLFAVHVFASPTISAVKTGARLACLLHDPSFLPGTEKAQQSC